MDVNEGNKGWGVTVTNDFQHHEVAQWTNALLEYTKKGISDSNGGRYRCDLV